MDKIEYAKKLEEFNARSKYIDELNFLDSLLVPSPKNQIVDYGCGIGTAIHYFKTVYPGIEIQGYDVNEYVPNVEWFSFYMPKEFDKAYFMHSFAHVKEIELALRDIYYRMRRGGRLVVFTPNANFLNRCQHNANYVPDPTVHKHYTSEELNSLVTDTGFKVKHFGAYGQTIDGHHERIWIIAEK